VAKKPAQPKIITKADVADLKKVKSQFESLVGSVTIECSQGFSAYLKQFYPTGGSSSEPQSAPIHLK
jgi:hypothetical protein